MYHYAGNNPIKYVDPDGRDIINSTDKYIIARLEKPLYKGTKNEIDTLIIPPRSIAYGLFDGARDEEGNYYKVTCLEEIPIAIDFEITENGDMVVSGISKIINDIGDKWKTFKDKNKSDDNKRILSGKKTEKTNLDYLKLKNAWDQTFKDDVGEKGDIGDSKSWSSKYNSDKQQNLRKHYRIKNLQGDWFTTKMHDAHVY